MPELASDEMAPESPNPKGSSSFGRLKLITFVVGVVIIECVVAYLYLPEAQNTSAAPLMGKPADAESLLELEADEQKPLIPQIEFDLGIYSEAAYQPTSATTLRIDFHLFGMVEESDLEELEKIYAINQQRIKEQVGIIMRSSEITDLTDSELGLIKRRILEKTNRILGKPYCKTILINEFSFIEQ